MFRKSSRRGVGRATIPHADFEGAHERLLGKYRRGAHSFLLREGACHDCTTKQKFGIGLSKNTYV